MAWHGHPVPRGDETEVLERQRLGDGEAVMDLEEIDLLRREPAPVGTPSSAARRVDGSPRRSGRSCISVIAPARAEARITSGSVTGDLTNSFAATTMAAAPSENGQQSYSRNGERRSWASARYVSIVISL